MTDESALLKAECAQQQKRISDLTHQNATIETSHTETKLLLKEAEVKLQAATQQLTDANASSLSQIDKLQRQLQDASDLVHELQQHNQKLEDSVNRLKSKLSDQTQQAIAT